ncbi:MAG: single-stranded DNA-binding protein [Acidimicrobiales bacterium]
MSYITVIGNLTGDPELRFTQSGKAVASFDLAENRRSQDKDGNEHEETVFWRVVAWRSLGENVAESLAKGMRALVHGRIVMRDWETQDGTKRRSFEIAALSAGPDLSFATAVVTRNEKRAAESTRVSVAAASGANGARYEEEPF